MAKRKVVSRKRRVVRRSSSFDLISFFKKNFLWVTILVFIPVTVLALNTDNLSNFSSAAGRLGKGLFRTQDVKLFGGGESTPTPIPTPTPMGDHIETIIVGGCNPPICRINYDFPPYNDQKGGDYIGPEFSSEACRATVMTVSACTNNSPAPRDTRPTAVQPQPTSIPQQTDPSAQGDTCMTVDTDLGPGCWCKNAGWKYHYCSNWNKPNKVCVPRNCP